MQIGFRARTVNLCDDTGSPYTGRIQVAGALLSSRNGRSPGRKHHRLTAFARLQVVAEPTLVRLLVARGKARTSQVALLPVYRCVSRNCVGIGGLVLANFRHVSYSHNMRCADSIIPNGR